MTNKLKGFLIGFGLLFFITILNSSTQRNWNELNFLEKLTLPFFVGAVGGGIGFLIGSGIRVK